MRIINKKGLMVQLFVLLLLDHHYTRKECKHLISKVYYMLDEEDRKEFYAYRPS